MRSFAATFGLVFQESFGFHVIGCNIDASHRNRSFPLTGAHNGLSAAPNVRCERVQAAPTAAATRSYQERKSINTSQSQDELAGDLENIQSNEVRWSRINHFGKQIKPRFINPKSTKKHNSVNTQRKRREQPPGSRNLNTDEAELVSGVGKRSKQKTEQRVHKIKASKRKCGRKPASFRCLFCCGPT